MVKRLKHSRSQWFCFSKWIKTTWSWVHSSRNTGSAPDPFISPVAWMASSDGKLGKMILLHVLFWHSTYVVMIESSWGFCIQKQKLKTLDEQIDTGVHSHSERGTWFVSAESSCASHYRVVGEVTETSAAPCSTCGGLGVDLWRRRNDSHETNGGNMLPIGTWYQHRTVCVFMVVFFAIKHYTKLKNKTFGVMKRCHIRRLRYNCRYYENYIYTEYLALLVSLFLWNDYIN